MGTVLAVKDLVVNYGAVQALKGVTLELGERDIVAVLGANGAGKTTLLKSISHIQPIRSGTILFSGKDLATVPAFRLAELGIAHVPEGRQVFATLTTEENLNVGAYGVRNQPAGKQLAKTKDWVFGLFPILKERRKQLAGTLSGGEQQMLAIGRGLISKSACPAARRAVGWDWHPSSSRRSSASSVRSTRKREFPSCWWSRTRARLWALPDTATFLNWGKSPSRVRPAT